MATRWMESKLSQCLNKCFNVSSSSSSFSGDSRRQSDAVSDSSSKISSSKRTCAICLKEMKRGRGRALFTGECSHTFHFRCITSSVGHGNQSCPLCRARWNEVPVENGVSTPKRQYNTPAMTGHIDPNRWTPMPVPSDPRPVPRPADPLAFDDDEILPANPSGGCENAIKKLEVNTVAEVSEVEKSVRRKDFAVLIHLKAPVPDAKRDRAPIDLVTVLDVSGSMEGTKIDLMKRAMEFVIQQLGPSDRLSVVAFCSTARRVFPLRLMSKIGKQEAVKAVNSLIAREMTNIAQGLKIGAKVISDRKWKNPVAGIIVLSDGHDNFYFRSEMDAESLIPVSIRSGNYSGSADWASSLVPIHTFGFGSDHDARLLHSISEITRGTFSFVENKKAILDAFAQCIGGLQSVVIQDLTVVAECDNVRSRIRSVKAGRYHTTIEDHGFTAWIDVGDLYAEEERDFLAILKIPVDKSPDEYPMRLLTVTCRYTDPVTKKSITLDEPIRVEVLRTINAAQKPPVSIDVDRHRNRFLAAQVISEARVLAEQGKLDLAVLLLNACERELSESVAAKLGDRLTGTLLAELLETQERMSSSRVYKKRGRAYVYSSISSHLAQRATARGDSTELHSRVRAYQNASMTRMVNLSQELGRVDHEPRRHSCPNLGIELNRPEF